MLGWNSIRIWMKPKYLPFLLWAPSHLLPSRPLVSPLCVQFPLQLCPARWAGVGAFLTPPCEAHIALPLCQTKQDFLGQAVRISEGLICSLHSFSKHYMLWREVRSGHMIMNSVAPSIHLFIKSALSRRYFTCWAYKTHLYCRRQK